MQLREDLYPDAPNLAHPHQFSPERWEIWTPKTWQYIPFNGGPRICIGQQFALTEIGKLIGSKRLCRTTLTREKGYTITRILQRYEYMDCHSPSIHPRYKSEVVLSPVNGVKVGAWGMKAE